MATRWHIIIVIKVDKTNQPTKTKMTKIIICLLLAAFAILVLVKMTDRICDKKYSKEFMQTQQYRDMQCPAK